MLDAHGFEAGSALSLAPTLAEIVTAGAEAATEVEEDGDGAEEEAREQPIPLVARATNRIEPRMRGIAKRLRVLGGERLSGPTGT